MKIPTLFSLVATISFSLSAQTTWHLKTTGAGVGFVGSQVSIENGQYLVRSSDVILNIDPGGGISGILQRPTNMGLNNLMSSAIKKYASGTADPYFIIAQRTLTGTQGYTLVEYRPGTGYLNPLILTDNLGAFTLYGTPRLFHLENDVVAAFGREFFRKIQTAPMSAFSELSSQPLENPITDVIHHNNQFVLTDEAGQVYALDLSGSELWSVTHPQVFRSIRAVGNGFLACVRTTMDASLVKLASDGTVTWSTTTVDKNFYEAHGTSDGGVIAVGTSAESRIVLVRFDANGVEQWRKEYDTGIGVSVTQGIDGGFVAYGKSGSTIYLIKTDEQGNTSPLQQIILRNKVLKTGAVTATFTPSARFLSAGTDPGFVSNADTAATIFSMTPWLAALDENAELHLSADNGPGTSSSADFRPGMANAPARDFNKVWRATKEEINRLRRDFGTDQALDQPIPVDILTWPGRGNPHLRYNLDFSPFTTDLSLLPAPFVDVNQDGTYNVFDGDFPLIKGDQMLWWVLTDSTFHGATLGVPLGVDLLLSAYAYDCPQTALADASVFLEVKIINRLGVQFDSTYLGFYTDFDIGCPSFDYLGSIPATNTVYAYNQDLFDMECNSIPGFEDQIPVQSVTFLDRSMDFSIYNSLGGSFLYQNPPASTVEFYRNLTGYWRDGVPLTGQGNGYEIGSAAFTNHMFPDDPSDPQGWSMCSSNLALGDVRALQSHGPFDFVANDTFSITLQLTLHRDIEYPCPAIFTTVQPELEQLQTWHDDGSLDAAVDLGQVVLLPAGQTVTLNATTPGAADYVWSTGASSSSIEVNTPGTYSVVVTQATGCEVAEEVVVQLASGVLQPAAIPAWNLMPNPANESVTLRCPDCENGALQITLRNAQGVAVVQAKNLVNTSRLDVQHQPAGLYWLELWQNGQFLGSRKLVLTSR